MTDIEDTKTQEEYLTAKLNHLIEDQFEKRGKARYSARNLKILLILLGSVTTVLIGLREFSSFERFGETLSIITLILSALATGLTAWDGFNNSSWKWAHYRDMLTRLYSIRDHVKFDARSEAGLSDDQCRDHFDQLLALLAEDREKWQSVRASNITGRKP